MKKTKILTRMSVCAAALLVFSTAAMAVPVLVTVTSNAPTNGTNLTPVWVGFHNGSFDSYDGGSPAALELERLAEDGNTGPISSVFGTNGTLVATGVLPVGTRVQGMIGAGPIGPGQSESAIFDLAADGTNAFFSYASMVLPSNDYFVANGLPTAHDLTALLVSGVIVSFDIGSAGTVNDAGTEINDFNTSAGNGLFPGLPPGQTGQNQGLDENGVITSVVNPYANFANSPGLAALASLNFNNTALYPNGIATITIEQVPEPGALALMAVGALGMLPGLIRGRRRLRGYRAGIELRKPH